jgi:glucose/arabinose dehydrogenase
MGLRSSPEAAFLTLYFPQPMRLFPRFAAAFLLSSFAAPTLFADSKGTSMHYGPILSCSLEAPKGETGFSAPKPGAGGNANPSVAMKAVIVKLGEHDEGYVAFDTDLMRMAAGWSGGFVDFKYTNIGNYKGDKTGAEVISGDIKFRTPELPGWSASAEATDPRPRKGGPLPADRGHYRGFYLHGNTAIFIYDALGRHTLESPELAKFNETPVFVRHFTVGPAQKGSMVLAAGSNDGANGWTARRQIQGGVGLAMPIKKRENGVQIVAVIGDAPGLAFVPGNSSDPVRVSVPASTKPFSFDIAILDVATQEEATKYLASWSKPKDLAPLCKGGPQRWPQTITATGTISGDSDAYVVDTIPVPENNEWSSWMRISGFDFFPDGRAAVCTFNGDVWIVSGIDEKLDKVTWKRYAAGLYEPLGLKIIGGKIYVTGRDRITRLTDVNEDGEADFYESFNSDRTLYPSYHAFAFDLQTDSKGNVYYVTGGNQIGHERPGYSCLTKISPDGTKSEPVGDGFRAPNGFEIGPHDEIAVSDNQGHWIPSSKISLVKPGGFYGHVADPRIDSKASIPPTFDQPLLWIPYKWDNSSAGGAWAPPGQKWGPFADHLIHTSYGYSSVFEVMDETVGDTKQAGIVKIPLKFNSGIMRSRFNPHDGQLYVAGLKGWQTNGTRDGCFQRVRYTGKPLYLPVAMHVLNDRNISITFATALDKAAASDAQNYSIQQWNYKWWSTYGSADEFSVAHPGQKGRDTVDVKSVQLSSDGKTVTITTEADLRKVEQMMIKMELKAADGNAVHVEVGNTINRIPGEQS